MSFLDYIRASKIKFNLNKLIKYKDLKNKKRNLNIKKENNSFLLVCFYNTK